MFKNRTYIENTHTHAQRGKQIKSNRTILFSPLWLFLFVRVFSSVGCCSCHDTYLHPYINVWLTIITSTKKKPKAKVKWMISNHTNLQFEFPIQFILFNSYWLWRWWWSSNSCSLLFTIHVSHVYKANQRTKKKRKKFLLFIPILLFHNFIYVDRFFLLLLCLAGRHSHLVGGDCSLDTASYAIAAAAAAAESLLDMTNRWLMM